MLGVELIVVDFDGFIVLDDVLCGVVFVVEFGVVYVEIYDEVFVWKLDVVVIVVENL